MSAPRALTIPAPVIEQISAHVTLDQPGALEAFVADALNSYMQLGALSAGGAQFWLSEGEGGEKRRMRLPFEAQEEELAQ